VVWCCCSKVMMCITRMPQSMITSAQHQDKCQINIKMRMMLKALVMQVSLSCFDFSTICHPIASQVTLPKLTLGGARPCKPSQRT
jgi:hypothetical protein